ncbi:unnamed protein product [Malus baccata var. baccata]
MATCHLHSGLGNPTSFKSTNTQASTRRELPRPKLRVTCETHRVTVKNENDSQDICRVLNGMWQTSGGWGRIDRDDAVEAMLRYADTGLSTFDMADHFVVKNGKDSLHICLVVNGMWQTSGSWDRSDRDNGVDAMLKYADAGVTTFDMADIFYVLREIYRSVHSIFFHDGKKRLKSCWNHRWDLKQEVFGLSEHIQDCNAVFSLTLDEEDRSSIKEVTKKGKNLLQVIGDCGDEYRRR